jgi:hypothetical protein
VSATGCQHGGFCTGEFLSAIGDSFRIDGRPQAMHEFCIGLAIHFAKERFLFESHTMLAGDRAAQADAQPDDFPCQFLSMVERSFLAAIKHDEGMQIAVTGVKDIGNTDSEFLAETIDFGERLAKPRSRYDTVLHDEVRTESANGGKRTLPTRPDLRPFCIVFRRLNQVSPGLFDDGMQLRFFGFDLFITALASVG